MLAPAATAAQVKSEEEEDDELTPEQLAARMKGEGIKFELKAPAASGRGK
jgi:hypothetical protein